MQEITTFISEHPLLSFATLGVFILVAIVEFLRSKRRHFQVTPLEMTQLINHENAVVIDMRNKDAYNQGHIIDALSFTSADLLSNAKKLDKYKTKPIIIVCQTGNDSQKIAASFLKAGYNVRSLAGGMRAWGNAQMPLIKETKNG